MSSPISAATGTTVPAVRICNVRARKERSERIGDGDSAFVTAAMESEGDIAPIPEKKPWSAPKLAVHGSVAEITGYIGPEIDDGIGGFVS
jgi:hypothetical protein